MSEVRKSMRERLDETERESEDWVYQIQKEDHDRAVTGIVIRCMEIASLHPDWSFFTVLHVCRKSTQQGVQLPELKEWTADLEKAARAGRVHS